MSKETETTLQEAQSAEKPQGYSASDLSDLLNFTGRAVAFNRYWDMPSADTFDVPTIKGFVQKYLMKSKVSIDPFARNKRWATYTNDLNPDTAAEYHLDALDFLKILQDKQIKADLCIFDPPYSLEQCKRSYDNVGRKVTMRDTQIWGRWTELKDAIDNVILEGGIVLSFGWNSIGMGLKRRYTIVDGVIVCHGGAHNDTICMAERKTLQEPGLFAL